MKEDTLCLPLPTPHPQIIEPSTPSHPSPFVCQVAFQKYGLDYKAGKSRDVCPFCRVLSAHSVVRRRRIVKTLMTNTRSMSHARMGLACREGCVGLGAGAGRAGQGACGLYSGRWVGRATAIETMHDAAFATCAGRRVQHDVGSRVQHEVALRGMPRAVPMRGNKVGCA